MDKLKLITEKGLCLGCGLCESIGKDKGYSVPLSKKTGFYSLVLPQTRDKTTEDTIIKCCPSINLIGDKTISVWGKCIKAFNAYSTDEEIRYAASSGGVVSSICLHLLNTGYISAVLEVAQNSKNILYNELVVSKSRSELLTRCSSRYAPSRTFHCIDDILKTNDAFCFVGKPCDVSAMKLFVKEHEEYKDKIRFYISIFCAGIPSYNATKELFALHNCHEENLVSIKYRGNGWPGKFKALFKNQKEISMDYAESWGKVLGRQIHFRCKICPDGVGLHGDISVGDAWQTASGYPDFTEKPGKSFVLVRSQLGDKILNESIKQKEIVIEEINTKDLSNIQPTQHKRRCATGYRILGIQIVTLGIFNIKDLSLAWLMTKYNPIKGVKNCMGSIKRFQKITKHS